MKKSLEIMLVLIILSSSACAADSMEENLIGKWLYSGMLNQRVVIECPDLFHIQSDGRYLILNDCYASNTRIPIVERGSWIIDRDNGKLILNNRIFELNYHFGKKDKLLAIHIKNVSENEFHLSFGDGVVEIYKKQTNAVRRTQ